MAFPTVISTTPGTDNSGGTAGVTVTLPSCSANDILVFVSCARGAWINSGSFSTPSGWTNAVIALARFSWKLADGTEGGTSVTFGDNGNAEYFAWHVIVVGSATGTPELAGPNTETDTPPSLTPSWGALDTLWMTFTADTHGSGDSGKITAYPANFTHSQMEAATGGFNDASCAAGFRQQNTATQSPGDWASTGGPFDKTWTVAFKPAQPVPPTSMFAGIIG